MKKIRWKSMLAFVLAFMLVISVVPVTQVNASETGESISVSGNTIGEPAEEGGADQENHGGNADSTDDDLSQGSQEQLDGSNDVENADGNVDNNESNPSQEELLLKDEDIITEQKNLKMTFMSPRMVSYPEITSFEFVENGKEIELGYDKDIHIIFKGTTMEGAEFSKENTKLLLKEPGGYQKYLTAVSVKETENEDEYELIFQIMSSNETRWEAGEYKFDYLTIGDSQGNMKSFDFSTADENSIPVFTVCLPVNTTIKLENIEFENSQFVISDEVLNPESLVKVEVEGDSEEDLNDTVILKYVCETPEESLMDNYYEIYYEICFSSFESENGKEFQTRISVDPRFSAGTYVLKEAYYETQSNGKEKISVDNIQSSFTIEKNYSDHDAPKILDLKIYYEGSEIEPGQSFVKEDTLEVHVKMEEDSETYSYINLASSGFNVQYVSFYSNEEKTIKHGDGTVTYIYDIPLRGPDMYQPMYAGEWFVQSIYAQDIYQNVTKETGYEVMYFYLKDKIDDAVTDPVFYCNVYVYKNGVQEVTLSPPSKRVTSVEEIFAKAQQEITNYTETEGFEGWYIEHLDKMVGSAEKFSFTGNRSDLNVTQVKIIPIYETKEITVEIQYTSESGTMTMEKKLTVGKEATYQEICDLLDKAEDIPHSSKLKLKGWTVGDDHDGILEETIPLGVYSVSVTAQYNEKSNDTGNEGGAGEEGSEDSSGGSGDAGSGEDSGNAGGSGDAGSGEDSGNAGGSDNTGDGDDSGNTGDSDDTGNEDGSGNVGGSGDTGNEDGSGNTGGSIGSGNTGSSGDSGNISDSADSGSTGVISTVIKPEEATEETEQEILLEIPRLIPETQVSEFPTLSTEDNEETTVAVKLEESVIAQKVEEARKADEGTSLVIEMTTEEGETATEIPVAVLESVKGKDVEIVLDMGDYSWTINGKDIQTEELEAINLQVMIDSNAIDTSVVEEFANGEPTRQITLVHNGEFGFKATLTINVGSQYEGQTGNLYYYNSEGELEFIDAGQIDADGNVNLDFSHASDYVVVVGRDRTEEESKKTEELLPAEIISEEVVLVEEEIEGTEKVLTLLVIIFAIVMAAGVVLVKKSRK